MPQKDSREGVPCFIYRSGILAATTVRTCNGGKLMGRGGWAPPTSGAPQNLALATASF